jgi:hypothetical protein
MTATSAQPPAVDAGSEDTGTGVVTTVVHKLVTLLGRPTRWRDAAVGAALEGADIGALMLAGLRRSVTEPSRRLSHRVAVTGAGAGRRLGELADRGAAAQVHERRRAAEGVDAALTAVAKSTVVNRVVDVQLERVIRPVIQVVLDDVLSLLEREPERIQALVRGQRDTIVDELVDRVRSGAAAGDVAVDRLTDRMLLRRGRPVPAPPAARR